MRCGPKPRPLIERVVENIEITPDGCWEWQRRIDRHGYAQIEIIRRPHRSSPKVHRVAYELWVGPIPTGMVIDHTCHSNSSCRGGTECPHRRCVNPDHLEPVTHKENIERGRGYGRVGVSRAEIRGY